MLSAGMKIVTGDGFKSLSEISDFEAALEYSGQYNKLRDGRHVIYTPEQGDYCIKKITVWSHEPVIDDERADFEKNDALVRADLSCSSEALSGKNRMVGIYDYILVESSIKRVGAYDAYICMEKSAPIVKASQTSAINICKVLCDLLGELKRPHGNINHHNIFQKDDSVILGCRSICGVKNDIVYYTAPEILRGEAATHASDVYSLGVWLYHMLNPTGRIFTDRDRYGVEDGDITIPDMKQPALMAVIRRALSCDPERRYKTPAEFRAALEKAGREKPKLPIKAIGIALAALVIISIGFFAISRYDPGAGKIRSMISSGSYSLAYKEICARESSEATDELIKEYIEGCMEVLDYKRAAQIIPELSQAMFDSPDYLEGLFADFHYAGKLSLLEPIMDRIYSRSDAIASVIDRYR